MDKNLLKLLIVDDEVGIRKGLTHFINWEKEGYTIVGDVSNGAEALKQIRVIKPDIIISDIVMPEMDGVSLMKLLQKLYPEIGVIILSSYDDFKYVKTVMQYGADDYLLKASLTPEELLSMLAKVISRRGIAREQSDAHNVTSNLSRHLSGFSSEVEKAALTQQLAQQRGYLVMAKYSKFSNVEQEKTDIHEIFRSTLSKDALSLASIGEVMVLLIQSIRPDEDMVRSFKHIAETVVMKYPHLFFIYSPALQTSEGLKEAYDTISQSLSQERFVNKQQTLVSVTALTPIDELSVFDMKQYLLTLTNHQFTQGLDYLDRYFQDNLVKNIEEKSLRHLVTNTIYNYLSSLEECFGESAALTELKLSIFSTLNDIVYLADFKGVFDDTRHQLIEFTERAARTYDGKLAQSLENYIREHSSEKITLKELAQEFHFSYSYLSSYFSTSMNESFNDFLNRVRIDKASSLLQEATLTISEISQEVGYSDVSYFSKVFKKIKGQTPTTYKRGLSK